MLSLRAPDLLALFGSSPGIRFANCHPLEEVIIYCPLAASPGQRRLHDAHKPDWKSKNFRLRTQCEQLKWLTPFTDYDIQKRVIATHEIDRKTYKHVLHHTRWLSRYNYMSKKSSIDAYWWNLSQYRSSVLARTTKNVNKYKK